MSRKTMLAKSRRIVLKVGSSLLVEEGGRLRAAWLATLAEDIAALVKEGKRVVIVTSGAVALGRSVMGFAPGALTLEEKQASASAGQIPLLKGWADAFTPVSLFPSLVLLTAEDSIDRRRYLNARNTFETLLSRGPVIPIVNENDTVATAELKIGDNDRLSARVAEMVSADCLVLFSDIDGLYKENPRTNPDAEFIPEIKGGITPEIEAYAGGAGTNAGTGGMVTKLQAAKIALSAGCHMAITSGLPHHALENLAKGGGKASWFIASETPVSARKRWIGGSLHAAGAVVVDEGAALALKAGKSLLPAGVTGVEGNFNRGDAVLIRDPKGMSLGKGLSAYASADARRICGLKSADIEKILGFKGRAALIHRDDMVLEMKD